MALSEEDIRFMAQATGLARRCPNDQGRISPKVGAVLVKEGNIVAEAYRGELKEGEHAEYTMLERKVAGADLLGATVYTTLEPCTARNPPKQPCSRRLIERGVARVVVGMLDPDPRISGAGVEQLRLVGIEVDLAGPEQLADLYDLNAQWTAQYTDSRRPWRVVMSMSCPRERHTGVALSRGVLLAGGFVDGTTVTETCELFGVATERWDTVPSMRAARAGHTATALCDGSVLVCGGISPSTYLASAELLLTDGTEWQTVGNMTFERYGHTATLLADDRVLVCGGYRNPESGREASFLASSAESVG